MLAYRNQAGIESPRFLFQPGSSEEKMGVAGRERRRKHVLPLGRREPRRCYQDRMQRYPDYLASDLGRSHREVQRLRQKINRSIMFRFIHKRI